MKVIPIHHPHTYRKTDFPPLSIALGFFDGVHKGHQKVINTAVRIAKENNWKSAVMTFDPHPSIVLGNKQKPVEYITPLQDKLELISSLHVDYLFVVRFTSAFAGLDPQQFVDDYLVSINVSNVTAGFDYTYGKYGKGTMDTLRVHAKDRFDVTTVSKLTHDEEKVSSTAIRELLREGRVQEAENFLGRFHSTKGTVIHGEKRGSKIGFPTANIRMNEGNIIPKQGVYAVKVFVSGKQEIGVCNIGFKPTFKDPDHSDLSIEVHIIDFKESIYGEEITVEWCSRIRDEKKFNGIEELKKQIFEDKQTAIKYLESIDY